MSYCTCYNLLVAFWSVVEKFESYLQKDHFIDIVELYQMNGVTPLADPGGDKPRILHLDNFFSKKKNKTKNHALLQMTKNLATSTNFLAL